MKHIYVLIICLFVISGCINKPESAYTPVKIILDTDLGPDYDDVGALAFLHAMADSGRAEILATISSNINNLVVPSIDVINTYFNRPDLETGAPKSGGVNLGSSQHWADSIVARYPHDIESTSEAPDAVRVYRNILSNQPDNTVTIVTIGIG